MGEVANQLQKDNFLKNPFEDTRKIFSCRDPGFYKNHVADLKEKYELFFNDYTFMPSFVYENYLNAEIPAKRRQTPSVKILSESGTRKRVNNRFHNHAKAINNISKQNILASKRIQTQNWSLLTSEAQLSVVTSGRLLCGGLKSTGFNGGWNGGVNFPAQFGKMSNVKKNQRQIRDLQAHAGRNIDCGSRTTFEMYYISTLAKLLVAPLLNSDNPDIDQAIDLALDYDLIKEDFDIIQEMAVWDMKNSSATAKEKMTEYCKVPTKVKTAFTRNFKKKMAGHQFHYSNDALAGIKKNG